jgi:hypothetical protein
MKRIYRLFATALLLCLCQQSDAYFQSRDSNYDTIAGGGGGGGGGPCSQYTTFIARTSGTSGTEQAAYQAMICGMVTDGTWTLLDVLYIFATNTTTTAALNLVSTSYTATVHGTLTFSADHGWTGDGSTGYLDSGFIPVATNFSQNSASAGVYDLTSRASQDGSVALGEDQNNFDLLIGPLSIAGGGGFSYSIAGTPQNGNANANAQGSYLVSRTAAASEFAFKNGSSIHTATDSSTTLTTIWNFYVFATNTGSPAGFTTDQLSAAWWGAGMTTTQAGQVQSRINAYMTGLGINVY